MNVGGTGGYEHMNDLHMFGHFHAFDFTFLFVFLCLHVYTREHDCVSRMGKCGCEQQTAYSFRPTGPL